MRSLGKSTTHVHTPSDGRIFVFSSNLVGLHEVGAARYASTYLSFPWGQGKGLREHAYAIPVCSTPGTSLSLDNIRRHVEVFLDCARFVKAYGGLHARRFFVSELWCELAGFSAAQFAPMLEDAPANCDLPPSIEAIWEVEP